MLMDNYFKKYILEGIINIELEGNGEIQCFLPINHGGIGIRLISDLTLPAFISSVYPTFHLIGTILSSSIDEYEVIYLSEAVQEYGSIWQCDEFPINQTIRKNWGISIINRKLNSISDLSIKQEFSPLHNMNLEPGCKLCPHQNQDKLLDKELYV